MSFFSMALNASSHTTTGNRSNYPAVPPNNNVMGYRTNQSVGNNAVNNRITMGTRIIDRLNFFYSPSAKDGYSHRVLTKPMSSLATQIFNELKEWAQPNVRQMLATACLNCKITYRNPFTGQEKTIESYEELSNAYVQNRDNENFSKYVYAFNQYFKMNRDWAGKMEARY